MPVYQKEIEFRYTPDILVCGGGPAGVAAAVSAARAGGNVMLIETTGTLGGMGTAGRVPMFCSFSDNFNFLAAGFGREIYDNMLAHGHANPADPVISLKKRHSISINPEYLKLLYDKMMVDSGAKLLFQTKLIDAIVSDGKIDYVVCQGKSDMFAIKAKIYIDCTGDADLGYHAGAEVLKGDEAGNMQAGTLCSLWTDIDWSTAEADGYYDGYWPRNTQKLEQAHADGIFSHYDKSLPGMWQCGDHIGGGNIGHEFYVDGTDEESLTKAFVDGRKRAQEYQKYYREYLGGCFKNVVLADTGSIMGIRETRRIVGDYMLVKEDYFREAVFDDEIGRYSYDIDVHSISALTGKAVEVDPNGTSFDNYQDGQSYGIPYRCLVAKGFSNLMMAGRCVSADRRMLGSIRVMPGCYITGQAAGIGAKFAVENNCAARDVDVCQVQSRLLDIGMYLPNFKK